MGTLWIRRTEITGRDERTGQPIKEKKLRPSASRQGELSVGRIYCETFCKHRKDVSVLGYGAPCRVCSNRPPDLDDELAVTWMQIFSEVYDKNEYTFGGVAGYNTAAILPYFDIYEASPEARIIFLRFFRLASDVRAKHLDEAEKAIDMDKLGGEKDG